MVLKSTKRSSSTSLLRSKSRKTFARKYITTNNNRRKTFEDFAKFKTHRVPVGFWKEQSNQRKFFDHLGKIDIQSLEDWYSKLSAKIIIENGGSGLLHHYKKSPIAALMAAYPEHNWIPWKFDSIPVGYWKSKENQRKYFDWLGKEIGVQQLDDWYQKLTAQVTQKNGGRSLLMMYKGSPMSALMVAYPEHNWIPWKFNNVPRSYWRNPANQKQFFDDLGKNLGIQNPDDWYQKLSLEVIERHGGVGLLRLSQYKSSAASALMSVYPEHNWVPWKFNTAPKGTWTSKDTIQKYLLELSEKLSIQTLDDWYRVDWILLGKFGAAPLRKHYGSLYNILKEQYPHHPWDPKRFHESGKKTQRWLAVTLKQLFPNDQILEDFMHPKVTFPSSNRPIQLDVFIPSKDLAFEYQGEHHYEEVGVFGPSKMHQQRDEEKRTLCAANNIKLIEVPYWWNRTREELEAMINKTVFPEVEK